MSPQESQETITSPAPDALAEASQELAPAAEAELDDNQRGFAAALEEDEPEAAQSGQAAPETGEATQEGEGEQEEGEDAPSAQAAPAAADPYDATLAEIETRARELMGGAPPASPAPKAATAPAQAPAKTETAAPAPAKVSLDWLPPSFEANGQTVQTAEVLGEIDPSTAALIGLMCQEAARQAVEASTGAYPRPEMVGALLDRLNHERHLAYITRKTGVDAFELMEFDPAGQPVTEAGQKFWDWVDNKAPLAVAAMMGQGATIEDQARVVRLWKEDAARQEKAAAKAQAVDTRKGQERQRMSDLHAHTLRARPAPPAGGYDPNSREAAQRGFKRALEEE
jgi:hypothetical protein